MSPVGPLGRFSLMFGGISGRGWWEMHPRTCTDLSGLAFTRFDGISTHFKQNIVKTTILGVGPWAHGTLAPWAQGLVGPGPKAQGVLVLKTGEAHPAGEKRAAKTPPLRRVNTSFVAKWS